MNLQSPRTTSHGNGVFLLLVDMMKLRLAGECTDGMAKGIVRNMKCNKWVHGRYGLDGYRWCGVFSTLSKSPRFGVDVGVLWNHEQFTTRKVGAVRGLGEMERSVDYSGNGRVSRFLFCIPG